MSPFRTLVFSFLIICCMKNICATLPKWLKIKNEFDHHSNLDDENYSLYWTSHTDSCVIEFGLEVKTSGWAAIGISLSGNMYPADVIIGWVDDKTGNVYLHNYYTIGHEQPILFDDQSGITLIDGWQQDIDGITTTYLHFEKELYPSQYRENSVDIAVGTSRVIYAFNQNDPANNDARLIEQHLTRNRGPKSLNLLSGETHIIELPEDAEYTDLLQPNVSIPNSDTTYMCTLLELPDFHNNTIQHVVRIDPVIQAGNEGLVHHIALYICPEQYVDTDWLNIGWDCDDQPNMATDATRCRYGTILYGWAIGGGNFYFPENAGYEIGGNSGKYIMMETHFDNPLSESGHIDASGLRLWHTPTLRENDAAMIGIGDAFDQVIPPGISSVWNYAWLTGECSTAGIPEEGVHIFASLNHLHLLGRQGIIRHIRNGTELEPIAINEAYDFNFQQYVPLQRERLLLPGDSIIIECNIDSTEREEMTIGGESTRQEMCTISLAVYPSPYIALGATLFFPDDKEQFYKDAKLYGYWDYERDVFDVTKEGALEYYNDFNSNPNRGRIAVCYDVDLNPILDAEYDIIKPVHGYKPYQGHDHFGCFDDDDDDDDDDNNNNYTLSQFEWDGWYVYFGGIVIGLLFIIFIAYIGYKCVVNNNENTKYDKELISDQELTPNDNNNNSMYGATAAEHRE